MAVAAYAAVVSLMHVLDQIQNYPLWHLRLDRDRIETLREKVSFLQDCLEVHPQRFYEDLEGLARQIAAVADDAEDIIDSHVVDQLHKGSADQTDTDLSISCEGINSVVEKIDSIKKELMMSKEGTTIQERGPTISDPTRSSSPPSSGNDSMVGFDEQFDQIVLKLIGGKSDLQVVPILGMGGIGKTTLARTAFDDQYMMQHFDIRIWVTISQDYNMKKVLFGFLSGDEIGDKKYEESDEILAILGERLYKKLYDRRYLVVMDDVWNTEVWNDLRLFFPDNSNGSRIIVTTRSSKVAISFSFSNPYFVDFLGEDKSWDLFCKKAFAKDGTCPLELEEVGKSIAKSCKGLPLAIVVIGGLLSKSNMTREHWEFVAEDVNSFANSEDDEHCLKILSLSYNHLPIHLKPCFLDMGVVPQDEEKQASELISLWVAKGFLKPIKDKTLEEVARDYLEDLIGRNLILIRAWTNSGKMNICGIHDLLRDLCIRESHKEHFSHLPRVQSVQVFNSRYPFKLCFLCSDYEATTRIDLRAVVVSSQPASLASCSVCDQCRTFYPHLTRLRFIKVLDSDYDLSGDKWHPTKLRVLSISGTFKLSLCNLIHLLWNLQTLIIDSDQLVVLPFNIWELPNLRHLIMKYSDAILPNPPLFIQVDQKDSTIILKNLQTLSIIRNFRWSQDAIERIPNLKKLGINYYHRNKEWSYYSLHSISRLRKLESLHLAADTFTLKNILFPPSLKKLTLWDCNIPWEEMTIIGSLPKLEVLKLHRNAFAGPEWNPIEEEFLQLKKLSIQSSDLVHWGAEKTHFPHLERLELRDMRYLEEIPLDIGEIVVLCSIRLHSCKESVVSSAKNILEEQRNFGNEDLQLYVDRELVQIGASR